MSSESLFFLLLVYSRSRFLFMLYCVYILQNFNKKGCHRQSVSWFFFFFYRRNSDFVLVIFTHGKMLNTDTGWFLDFSLCMLKCKIYRKSNSMRIRCSQRELAQILIIWIFWFYREKGYFRSSFCTFFYVNYAKQKWCSACILHQ